MHFQRPSFVQHNVLTFEWIRLKGQLSDNKIRQEKMKAKRKKSKQNADEMGKQIRIC